MPTRQQLLQILCNSALEWKANKKTNLEIQHLIEEKLLKFGLCRTTRDDYQATVETICQL